CSSAKRKRWRAKRDLGVIAAFIVLAVAAPATGAPSRSQTFFRAQILADEKTTDTIVDLLRHGGGFVADPVRFADLTGDGKQDAVALVDTGGAAGVVAMYVFSTDSKHNPNGDLQVVYRQQKLARASIRLPKAGLSF